MKTHAKLTIIIPAFNEAENIIQSLNTLRDQMDAKGNKLSHVLYQIVVVDNNSSDKTVELVKEFASENTSLKLYIVKEVQQGITNARICGYNYVLQNDDISTVYLASGDADIWYHPKWVFTVLQYFERIQPDVISNAGCFADSLWSAAPKLVERYLDEIGTIFFNQSTTVKVAQEGKKYNFTEQLFFDFGRQVTDGCFAITREMYKKAGGYTLEYWDKGKKQPIHGEGWRLCFKVERLGGIVDYVNTAPYSSNPRRILEEPEKFLSATSYDHDMTNLRNVPAAAGQRLNKFAEFVDLKPVQKYIVEYYILLRCIIKPRLIKKNIRYLTGIDDKLYQQITEWWENRKDFGSKEVFEFSHLLGEQYFEDIMQNLPREYIKN